MKRFDKLIAFLVLGMLVTTVDGQQQSEQLTSVDISTITPNHVLNSSTPNFGSARKKHLPPPEFKRLPSTQPPAVPTKPRLEAVHSFGFIPNLGQIVDENNQTMPSIKFTYRAPAFHVQFTSSGLSYIFHQTNNSQNQSNLNTPKSKTSYQAYRMDVRLVGANPQPEIVGTNPTEAVTHYYLGHCPNGITNVPTYQRIVYKNVYRGIDWVFTLDQNQVLKHEFIVQPGADPNLIKLAYDGATNLKLNADGSLTCSSPLGSVQEQAPVTFSGHERTQRVTSQYKLTGNVLQIKVGNYDRSLPLIIDPVIRQWATYYGGGQLDEVFDITQDSAGNYYIIGNTGSLTAISTVGAFQPHLSGGLAMDFYIAKFNANGTRLWGTYYGGTADEYSAGIEYDPATDRLYMSGSTSSNGMATTGVFQTTKSTGADGLVAAFSTGGIRQWATYFGDTGTEQIPGIKIDGFGNLIIAGTSTGANSLTTAGTFQTTSSGGTDFLIAKLTNTGLRVWCTLYGDNGDEIVAYNSPNNIIAITPANEIVICGSTTSTANIALPSAHQPFLNGGTDGVIALFSANGQKRHFGTYFGGSGISDIVNGVVVDSNNNLYFCGSTNSDNYIAYNSQYKAFRESGSEGFIGKMTLTGGVQWSTYYGGAGTDRTLTLTVYHDYIAIAGETSSSNNISSPFAYQEQLSSVSNTDAYIAIFHKDGWFNEGTYYGGPVNDWINCLLVNKAGNLVFGGTTYSSIGLSSSGAHQISAGGQGDGFFGVMCDAPMITYEDVGHNNCSGQNSGWVSIWAQNYNQDPMSYVWSNGPTSNYIINLANGVYTVTVTSTTGCTVTRSYTIGSTFGLNLGNASSNQRVSGVDMVRTGKAVSDYVVSGLMSGTVNYNPLGTTTNATGQGFVARYSPQGVLRWVNVLDPVGGASVIVPKASVKAGQLLNNQTVAFAAINTSGGSGGMVDLDPGSFSVMLSAQDAAIVGYDDLTGNLLYSVIIDAPNPPAFVRINTLELDNRGNVIVAGAFQGSNVDFDPSTGTSYLSSAGTEDAFIASYDKSGRLNWVKHITNGGAEGIMAAAVSPVDNTITLVGYFNFSNLDLDPGAGSVFVNTVGQQDFFVVTLNAGDGTYVGSYSAGTNLDDTAMDVVVDEHNNKYVVGNVLGLSIDFDNGPGTLTRSTFGLIDAFILKLNPSHRIVWGHVYGNAAQFQSFDVITLNPAGQLQVSGPFAGNGIDFDPSGGVYNLSSSFAGVDQNIVMLTYNSSDGSFVNGNVIGTADNHQPFDLYVNSQFQTVMVGGFAGTSDFDPTMFGTFNLVSNGGTDGFVTLHNSDFGLVNCPRPYADFTISPPTCAGALNGSITLRNFRGGAGDSYEYSIVPTSSSSPVWTLVSGTEVTKNNLTAGQEYEIRVRDYNNPSNEAILTAGVYMGVNDFFGMLNNNPVIVNDAKFDKEGNIWVCGTFTGTMDFDLGAGTHTLASNGLQDGFLAKYDQAGNFKFVRHLAGNAGFNDVAVTLEVDNDGNILLVGTYVNTFDIDPGPGIVMTSAGGTSTKAYLVKYDKLGRYIWHSDYVDATASVRINDIAVGPSNEVAITGIVWNGATNIDLDPGTGTQNVTADLNGACFIASYSSAGSYRWHGRINTGSREEGTAVAYDSQGNVYLAFNSDVGGGNSIDVDLSAGVSNVIAAGGQDAFLVKYNNTGGLLWSRQFASSGAGTTDNINSIVVDRLDNVYVGGVFTTSLALEFTNLAGGSNNYLINSSNLTDGFITKMNSEGHIMYGFNIGGAHATYDKVTRLALDNEPQQNLYVVGRFSNTVDFNPSTLAAENRTGTEDAFIAKYNSFNMDFIEVNAYAGTGATDEGTAVDIHPVTGSVLFAGRFTGNVDFNPGSGTKNINATTENGFFGVLNQALRMDECPKVALTISAVKPISCSIAKDGRISITKPKGGGSGKYEFSVVPSGNPKSYQTFDDDIETVYNLDSITYDVDIRDANDATNNTNYKVVVGNEVAWVVNNTGFDRMEAIAVDRQGNTIITGTFSVNNTNFNPRGAAINRSPTGGLGSDIFVAKYDPKGFLMWVRTWGGSDNVTTNDIGRGITVDEEDNIYVVGSFYGNGTVSNPASSDPAQTRLNAGSGTISAGFIQKFDPNGKQLWVANYGDNSNLTNDACKAIKYDRYSNSIIVTSRITNTGSDAALSTQVASTVAGGGGGADIIIAKYTTEGVLVWAKAVGGAGLDEPYDIAVDKWGNSYVAAVGNGSYDLDPGPGVVNSLNAGLADGLLLSLDPNGNYRYGRNAGGVNIDSYRTVDVDDNGNVYVSGVINGNVTANINHPGSTYNMTFPGPQNAILVASYDFHGNVRFAFNYTSSSVANFPKKIVVTGNSFWLGANMLSSQDLDPGPGTAFLPVGSTQDAFLVQYDLNGNYLTHNYFLSSATDAFTGLAKDQFNNLAVGLDFAGNVTVDMDKLLNATYNITTGTGSSSVVTARFNSIGGMSCLPITAHLTVTPVDCPTASNGTLTLDQPKGSPTERYQYSIVNHPGSPSWQDFPNMTNPTVTQTDLTSVGKNILVRDKDMPANQSTIGVNYPVGQPWIGKAGGTNLDDTRGVKRYKDGSTVMIFRNNGAAINFGCGALPAASLDDIAVAKFSPDGSCMWSFLLSGALSNDSPSGLDIDDEGNIYIVGRFAAPIDFDPGPATVSITPSSQDGFVASYDKDGKYRWAFKIGASSPFDVVNRIAVSPNHDEIYITGSVAGTLPIDFDPGNEIFNLTPTGTNADAFIASYNKSGGFRWAGLFGSTLNNVNDFGVDVALDSEGNPVFVGTIMGTNIDMDIGPGTVLRSGNTITDNGYVVKYSREGHYLWDYTYTYSSATTITNRAVRVDSNNNVFVGINYIGTVDFDIGIPVYNLTPVAGTDFAILKLNPNGQFVKAVTAGGNGATDNLTCLDVDPAGNIYVGGQTSGSVDLAFGQMVESMTFSGSAGFIAKVDNNLNHQYVYTITDNTSIGVFTLDAYGNDGGIIIGGYFSGTNIDLDPSPLNTALFSSAGSTDAFYANLNHALTTVCPALGVRVSTVPASCPNQTDGSVTLSKFTNASKDKYDYSVVATGGSPNFTALGSNPSATVSNLTSAGLDITLRDSDNTTHTTTIGTNLSVGNPFVLQANSSTNSDVHTALAYDPRGGFVAVGHFAGNMTLGSTTLTSTAGLQDCYVTRILPNGQYQWAFGLGNLSGDDEIAGVAVDADGNIFVTGGTGNHSIDFDPSAGTFAPTNPSGVSFGGYVASYTTSGKLRYAFFIGGANTSVIPSAIAVDTNKNIYVTGTITGTSAVDLDPGPLAANITGDASDGIFIASYDQYGNYRFGGIINLPAYLEQALSITCATNGRFAVTGVLDVGTYNFNLLGGTNNITTTMKGGFTAVYDTSGNFIDTYLINNAICYDVAMDKNGNLFTVGTLSGTADMDPGPGVVNLTAQSFIQKLSPAGAYLKAVGFSGLYCSIYDVSVDAQSNIVVTGTSGNNVDLDPGLASFNPNVAGNFWAQYDQNLNFKYGHRTTFTGKISDVVAYLDGKFAIAGYTSTTSNVDMDPTATTANIISSSINDQFVVNYNNVGSTGCPPVSALIVQKPITCTGMVNGQLYLNYPSGGGGTYQYRVNSGSWQPSTPVSALNFPITLAGTSNTGNYSIELRDGANPSNSTVLNGSQVVGKPHAFALTPTTGQQINFIDLTVDPGGYRYVTGLFSPATIDADPGPGTHTLTRISPANDVFVGCYAADGSFRWAFNLGVSGLSGLTATAITYGDGYIYIAGQYNNSTTDFDPGPGTANLPHSLGTSGYIAKYRASDGTFIWAAPFNLTTGTTVMPVSLTFNPNANYVYLCGNFQGDIDLNPSPSLTDIKTQIEGVDMFIACLSSQGNYIWGTKIGGTGNDNSLRIRYNIHDNNVYLVGSFTDADCDFDIQGSSFFLTNASPGLTDGFVSSYNALTGNFYGAFGIHGGGFDEVGDIAFSYDGDLIVSGRFQGPTVDFNYYGSGPAYPVSSLGGTVDAFLARYNSVYKLQWFHAVQSMGTDIGRGVVLTLDEKIYWTGNYFGQPDIAPGPQPLFLPNRTVMGSVPFYAGFNADGTHLFSNGFGDNATGGVGRQVAVDDFGNPTFIGSFIGSGTMDFDPGPEALNITGGGGTNAYLVTLNEFGRIGCGPVVAQFDLTPETCVNAGNGILELANFSGGLGNSFQYSLDNGVTWSSTITPPAGDPTILYNQNNFTTYNILVRDADNPGNQTPLILNAKLGTPGAFKFGGNGGTITTRAVALMPDGGQIIAGLFDGTVDFDPGPATFNLAAPASQKNGFVARYNAQGDFVWAFELESNQAGTDNVVNDVIILPGIGIFATGTFHGTTDYHTSLPNTFTITASGDGDIFLMRIDPTGYVSKIVGFGSSDKDAGLSLDVDLALGSIFVSGYFSGSARLNPHPDALNDVNSNGLTDAFLASYNLSDFSYNWGFGVGGSGNDQFSQVAVSAGRIYVGGEFQNTIDINPGPGTVNLTASGLSDIVLAKYSATGTYLDAGVIGGTGEESITGLKLTSNDVVITGNFTANIDVDPGPGTITRTNAGLIDAFVGKYSMSDFSHVWDRVYGSADKELIFGLDSDASGNLYLVGSFKGMLDFDPGPGTFTLTSHGGTEDGFVTSLDNAGGYRWVNHLPTTGNDKASRVAVSEIGYVVAAGDFTHGGGVDFDPHLCLATVLMPLNTEAYIWRFNKKGVWQCVTFGLAYRTSDPNCFAAEDGTIEVRPFCGQSPYTYRWSSNVPAAQQSNSSINSLIADKYTVTVTDARGLDQIASIELRPLRTFRSQFIETINTANQVSPTSGYVAKPALGDLDGDGDLDAVLGEILLSNVVLRYYRNDGTPAVYGPFTELTSSANPFNAFVLNKPHPALVDIDLDGDLDCFVGLDNGTLNFYLNVGTPISPSFLQRTGSLNPFNGVDVGSDASPTFVDIDFDGDLDCFIGDQTGDVVFYQNQGNPYSPAFVAASSPLTSVGVGGNTHLMLMDVDRDGDFDAYVSGSTGAKYYENTGTPTAPTFTQRTGLTNPFAWLNQVSPKPILTPGDINNDGYIDLLANHNRHVFLLNQPTDNVASVYLGHISCLGGADGKININIRGGNPCPTGTPYTFQWQGPGSFSATTQNISGLVAGNYHLTVTNCDNCTQQFSYRLLQPVATEDVFTLQTGSNNPLDGVDVGNDANLHFVDIDADSDLDVFLTNLANSDIVFYKNTGSSSSPSYTLQTGSANPLDAFQTTVAASLTFGDLDSDGDQDVIIGSSTGTLRYLRNTGTATSPTFEAVTAGFDNIPSISVASYSTPKLADLDFDGDLDLVIGNGTGSGNFSYYPNTGTPFAPLFAVPVTGGANPFNSITTPGYNSNLNLVDFDQDGLIDALVDNGAANPTVLYYRNTGTVTGPVFTLVPGTQSPFNTITQTNARTAAVDIDGDLDIDLFIGKSDGTYDFYRNTGQGLNIAFSSTPAVCNGANGSIDITVTGGVKFSSGPAYLIDWLHIFGTPAHPSTEVEDPTALLAGTYTVTVTDAAGCSTFVEIAVNAGSTSLSADITPTHEVCAFGRAGSISVNPTSGTAPYSYNWAHITGTPPPSEPQNVTTLFYGRYTVTVTDNLGCSTILRTNVTQPASGLYKFEFLTGTLNPFSGVSLGAKITPALVDIDADGDLDAFLGSASGQVAFYRNTGTSSQPIYTHITGASNPFDGVDVGDNSYLTFGDLDNDGDFDCFIGSNDGTVRYYLNTGTAAAPTFTQQTGSANPLDAIALGTNNDTAPFLIDIDFDGDWDVFLGKEDGTIDYYLNTGTITSPTYAQQTGGANPLNGEDVGTDAVLGFADFDGDGDYDLVVTNSTNTLNYYRNTGSPTASTFVATTGSNNPFNLMSFNTSGIGSAFADLNNDGKIDGVFGGTNEVYFYQNRTETMGVGFASSSPTCNGGTNGSITASVIGGGSGTPVFAWSTGGSTATISGLSAGVYTVTASSASGCVVVERFTLTQPNPITQVLTRLNPISCAGGNDGSFEISTGGATSTPTFSWSGGAGTNEDPTGLAPGTYTVTVTVGSCNRTFTYTMPATPKQYPEGQQFMIDGGTLKVNTVMQFGGKTYFGGDFNYVGVPCLNVAVTTTDDDRKHLNYPAFNGDIFVAEPDGSGGWYIGGNFTLVGGVARPYIVHINADYTVDASFNAHCDGAVNAIIKVGNSLYIGGNFMNLNSVSYTRLAKLNATTGAADPAFNPTANGEVFALAFSDDYTKLYVGGTFTIVNSTARNRLARINPTNGLLESWNPNVSGNQVSAIATHNNRVFIGGDFTAVNGVSRNYVAGLDALDETNYVHALNPNPDGRVNALAYDPTNNILYFGGIFTTAYGQARNNIAAANVNTNQIATYNPGTNGEVFVIEKLPTNLIVGGAFSQINSQTRKGVAMTNLSGTVLASDISANGTVYAAKSSGSQYFVGGNFTTCNGGVRHNLASIDQTSGQLSSFAPNVDGQVISLENDGTSIYVGGNFNSINGNTYINLAKLSTTGTDDPTFTPDPDGRVLSLKWDGSKLFVGGEFNSIASASRNLLAAVNPSGSINSFTANVTSGSYVNTMLIQGSTLYVGGNFSVIKGVSRQHLAAIDLGTTNVLTAFDANAVGTAVNTLTFSNNKLYVGGLFSNIGGKSRNNLAELNPTTGTASSFNPNPNNTVHSLSILSNTLYVGGNFTTILGNSRNGLAAINLRSGLLSNWDLNLTGGGINSVSSTTAGVWIGGAFTNEGSSIRFGIR